MLKVIPKLNGPQMVREGTFAFPEVLVADLGGFDPCCLTAFLERTGLAWQEAVPESDAEPWLYLSQIETEKKEEYRLTVGEEGITVEASSEEGVICALTTLYQIADYNNAFMQLESGAVDAIAPMLDAIAYSRQKGKPVVASCDLCASAAYYVACHCDEVVADNAISAEFGSIGVMMQFPDYAKYYEQKGIKIHTIYSDLSDWKNAPFEAARKGDYKAIRQEMLNPLARQFQEAVKSHRKDLKQEVEGILNGRVFYARQALEHGLIDEVGTVEGATEQVRRLSARAALEQYAANL